MVVDLRVRCVDGRWVEIGLKRSIVHGGRKEGEMSIRR